MQLGEVERLTKSYADAYGVLVGIVAELNDEIEQLKRGHLAAIRRAVRSAAERKAELSAAIKEGPELFIKPRTYVFHGVKVGMRRDGGDIEWQNEEDVVRLIKKHFADRVDELIRTTEKPSKSVLESLPPADLKRIGVTSVEAHDEVVIAPTDTNVDKIVSALLKDAEHIADDQQKAA